MLFLLSRHPFLSVDTRLRSSSLRLLTYLVTYLGVRGPSSQFRLGPVRRLYKSTALCSRFCSALSDLEDVAMDRDSSILVDDESNLNAVHERTSPSPRLLVLGVFGLWHLAIPHQCITHQVTSTKLPKSRSQRAPAPASRTRRRTSTRTRNLVTDSGSHFRSPPPCLFFAPT